MEYQRKQKIVCLIISIIVDSFIVLLYFLDNSDDVAIVEKILSCTIICIWAFFISPTILYYYYKIKNSSDEVGTRFFVQCGINGFIVILLAPYCGIKAYYTDLTTVKLHDFWGL